ncbi:MAG: molybdate ABC transporter permease subunit, partial [Sulfurimonas sp.]|nr:molybdate ABC transporter permease subunit [Sulfurimonas sp.]
MLELLSQIEFEPFLLSFKLAGLTTLILFTLSVPFAWYLS